MNINMNMNYIQYNPTTTVVNIAEVLFLFEIWIRRIATSSTRLIL